MADDNTCHCDEGWCPDPNLPTNCRKTHPLSGGHHIVLTPPMTDSDRVLDQHKAIFDGAGKGISGFLWSQYLAPKGEPASATMFPLSPMVDGHCIWAATRHSVAPYATFHGSIMHNFATRGNAEDLFPLTRITAELPTSPLVCPVTNSAVSAAPQSDFSLLVSQNVNPGHFWIPDPSPLTVGEVVALFGTPGGGPERSISAMDLASSVVNLISLFTFNAKSVSTGIVVGCNDMIVSHDASTMGGFCGAVGVRVTSCQGFKFSFIHTGQHNPFGLLPNTKHNHGLYVNDPNFKAAYITHVVPLLRDARGQGTLNAAQQAAIRAYVPDF